MQMIEMNAKVQLKVVTEELTQQMEKLKIQQNKLATLITK